MHLTLISRLSDQLPLAADSEKKELPNSREYESQRQQIIKRLSENPPASKFITIESGEYNFQFPQFDFFSLVNFFLCQILIFHSFFNEAF